jgi:hypothetical protein
MSTYIGAPVLCDPDKFKLSITTEEAKARCWSAMDCAHEGIVASLM